MTRPIYRANQNGDAFSDKTLVRAFSSWEKDPTFSRTIEGRNGASVRVQAEGEASRPKSYPPTINLRADIYGTATVRVKLSRKAARELARALEDAIASFELDAVHDS